MTVHQKQIKTQIQKESLQIQIFILNYFAQVMLCDNLSLPFRDESLDAVLSVAVIHHVATAERRVRALRELARVVRVGGRVMISVWAMEQRHRKVKCDESLAA